MQEVIGSTPLFSTSFKSPERAAFFVLSPYMIYTVYILYSALLDKYYIGQTEDITTRLSQHNSGRSPYTSGANDWTLMYTESFSTRPEAAQRERQIKKKKSRKYVEWLINSNKNN